MAFRGCGRGGNGISPLILIVINFCRVDRDCFLHSRTRGGKNYAKFADATASHLHALCGSVEKNADSLVKKMTLCAQVGGGGGGGGSKILAGNSPAGPPRK